METVSIGKVVATHGIKGELIVQHGLGSRNFRHTPQVLMLEENTGSKLPWFVLHCKARTEEEMLISLEGIDSREKALPLLQKRVWLQQADFEKMVSERSTIALLGYDLIEKGKVLGTIEEVIEQPHQIIAVTHIQDCEVLIPLHEATLQKIDRRKKQVHVQLPSGLLEVYLSPKAGQQD